VRGSDSTRSALVISVRGTASRAPIGPMTQVQNTRDRKVRVVEKAHRVADSPTERSASKVVDPRQDQRGLQGEHGHEASLPGPRPRAPVSPRCRCSWRGRPWPVSAAFIGRQRLPSMPRSNALRDPPDRGDERRSWSRENRDRSASWHGLRRSRFWSLECVAEVRVTGARGTIIVCLLLVLGSGRPVRPWGRARLGLRSR